MQSVLKQFDLSGRLALVRTPAAFAADYGFVWLRQRSLSPAAQAFLGFLQTQFQQRLGDMAG